MHNSNPPRYKRLGIGADTIADVRNAVLVAKPAVPVLTNALVLLLRMMMVVMVMVLVWWRPPMLQSWCGSQCWGWHFTCEADTDASHHAFAPHPD